MTDIAKALAFATHCLKWTDASLSKPLSLYVEDLKAVHQFTIDSAADCEIILREFLGNRYFIQVNRGAGSLFHWRVIVGWQDRTDKTKSMDNAVGVGEDLWDAVFDACVQAAGMFEKPATQQPME